ncbi:MAG: type II toxin-antitoxin system VapC family toxin [Desulfurococcales archaeon]|nr:type II toxin-antitoxin system VapC family toxin [Desulfurococcales archaeon]
MIYLDTSVIVSYMDESDSNHAKSISLLNKIRDKKVASELTIVELSSVYSRAGLENPLALSLYSVKKVGANVIDVDFNQVLMYASKLSQQLKLRTLDLLHITTAKIVEANQFATFDKDIIAKSRFISQQGIEVIGG